MIETGRPRTYQVLLASLVIVLMLALTATRVQGVSLEDIDIDPFPEHAPMECSPDGFYTMKDIETEEVILQTARRLHSGNEYINQHNILYRVEEAEEATGWARRVGEVDLSDLPEDALALSAHLMGSVASVAEGAQDDEEERRITVAVYHSHGAEAYVPSDGDEFIDEGGGILRVGQRFRKPRV